MALQRLLLEERYEQSQWSVGALLAPSTFNTPISRQQTGRWYLSILETLDQVDGSRGNFDRSFAHTAVKILDIHLSSRASEGQQSEHSIERVTYKSMEVASLFAALQTKTDGSDGNSFVVAGVNMSLQAFFDLCKLTNDVESLDDIAATLERIRASIQPFVRLRTQGTPIVSTDFFDILKQHVIENHPDALQGHEFALLRAEELLNHAFTTLWFTSYAPSLIAVAALAAVGLDQAAIEGVLSFFWLSGGTDMKCLRHIVLHFKTQLHIETQTDANQIL